MRKQKDLFGNQAETKLDRLSSAVKKHDENTFKNRTKRYKFLESIYHKNTGMIGTMEPIIIFEEARLSFLNGAFIATIILCQAAIEHWLTGYLESKNDLNDIPKTMEAMLNKCRHEGLIHTYLIDKMEWLKRVRNSFTHRKNLDHPFLLSNRIISMEKTPADVLEQDAEDALILMHILYYTKGYLYNSAKD